MARALKTFLAVGLGVAAIGGLAACGSGTDVPDGSVAQVGDARISAQELQSAVEQQQAAAQQQNTPFPEEGSQEYTDLRRQLLEQLVLQRVVEFEARTCGARCEVTDAQVDAELEKIKKDNFQGSQQKLDEFLKQSKLTLDDARRILRLRLQQPKLYNWVTRGIRFTNADALAYYRKNPTQFDVPASRTASHILVKTKAEAERIRRQLTTGNFAALAKKYSTDTGSKAQGGNLGAIQRGQLVPEFERVAFSLKDGQISKPVKTQFGWHLITVDVTPERHLTFAQARRSIIANQLKAERDAAFAEWRDKVLADWRKRTTYSDPSLAPQTDTAATTPTAPVETAPATTAPATTAP